MKELIRKLHVDYLRLRSGSARDLSTTVRGLIVAPHPDDEVIGCGGLIARLIVEGCAPHVFVLTGGEGSHRGCCDTPEKDIVKARRGLTREALSILGVPELNIHEFDLPDGGIGTASQEERLRLKALFGELKPDAVFVPHWGEGWPDHVDAAKIVRNMIPANVAVWEYCVWMWYYNVWRELDWRNVAVLRMTPQEYELKLRAIDAYTKPLAPCGKPWSGVLPDLFLKANRWNKELYFKVR